MKLKGLVVAMAGLALTLGFTMVGHTQDAPKAKFSPNIEAKNVISFPLVVKFNRPAAAVKKSNFPMVTFSHGQHMSVNCVTCHHTWDGKSPVQGCNEDGCHSDTVNRADSMSYYKAFHSRDSEQSCLGCHIKLNEKATKKIKISPCSNNVCHVPAK